MPLALNIAGGAITQSQNGSPQINVGTTAQPTLPLASAAGTCLIAIFGNMVGATVVSGPAGWSKLISQDQGGVAHIEVWVRPNNPGGIQTASFTTSTGGVVWQCHMSEWSNVSTTAALDASGTLTATSGTTLIPVTSSNVTVSGDLAISAWVQKIAVAGVVTFTTPATFTRLIDDGVNAGADTGLHHFDAEYKINPSTGATLGPTLTSNTTTTSAAGVIICLQQANPAVDQTNFLKYGSMTLKYNTFDFALVDPATVPSLGDVVALTTPTWNGRVASVTKSDIVDRATSHKLITVAATNQSVVATPVATLVQSGTVLTQGSGTTITPTLGVASTAGNCLVAYVTQTVNATSTAPANWVKIAQLANSNPDGIDVWVYLNNPGGISSAAFGVSNATSTAEISEWSSNVFAVDVVGTATQINGTTLTPVTAGSISQAGDVAISGWLQGVLAGATATFTTPTGWTRLKDNGSLSSQYHLDLEYQINPTPGSTLGPTLTSTLTSGRGAIGAIVTLKTWLRSTFDLSDAPNNSTTYGYSALAVQTTQNSDGTITTRGACTIQQTGLAAGQTFTLTSANLGYSAQTFYITNVYVTWRGLQTPTYHLEFGDALMTMQTAGGGVLTKFSAQASTQAGTVMPAGVLGYAQVTANQTGITAVTDLTGLALTATVASGRRIRVTAVTNVFSTVAQDLVVLQIMEGATVLQSAVQNTGATTSTQQELNCAVILTPTAGAHTYKLTLTRVGTGNAALFASATYPAYILVEDIGT